MTHYLDLLTEAGVQVHRPALMFLSEAAQLKITDETLGKMFKFITDKYNSLDFSEIEKSAGDIRKFKYAEMIRENVTMLKNIYEASTDSGAAKYVEVTESIGAVLSYLNDNAADISAMYKSGNGVIQLLYTSMVASCLYSTGALVSNTIRFVTVEQDTDCQVLFDEIPGSMKHVHIKNVIAVAKDLGTISSLLTEFKKTKSQSSVNESITITTGTIVALSVIGVIVLIPRIIVLIREIIYSIYYSRVRTSDMLDLQIDLIKTNIESLESGRGNKKIIARQKKIVDKLERWKNRVAIKFDSTEVAMKQQKQKEDRTLALDKHSPIVQAELSGADTGTILL